ncbi:MAG TPA: VIT domain-containing protein [Candidatus Polarisedimenticolia bacterium]|nr:VIT domain-containing protein [Candidatus Polarisedimenticolia bacterium]
MPLRHTDVRADVTGFLARVEVVQTFGNPFESAIEATYVFPLPERAAVDGFLLEVGERRIRGEIHRREEARGVYETARAAGYTASLLDQERPNVFTQSVANIPPGKEIRVHLRYIDILPFADGAYRFLYPMVVGPRYSPSSIRPATDPSVDATGPSYLRPGSRPGNDISVTLDLDAGVTIHSLMSESHEILVTRPGPTRARVTLAPGDTLPNKDLMLRWVVAGVMPEVGLLAHRAENEGFFALMIQPKAEIGADEAAPKEVIFVLDQSGSMSGLPIEMSKRFMRLALQTLGPQDRFNIVRFDSVATALARQPLANTQQNVSRGLEAIEAMKGSGGTEMLAGFDAALSQPRDARCIRIVFFLTDGYIGNEEDIFRVIRTRGGDARIFTLGVGSSVNHHLLRGMADLGHGSYQYVRPDGHETEAVEQFQRWVTKPYLTDLEIDWGSLRVEDIQPSHLPDLYSGQTLSVVGRYLWGGTDNLIIRGRLGGVPWEKQVEVTLPERSDEHSALSSVWARQRIQDLLMRPGESPRPEIEAQVTSLALAFRLMSPFTSFVAVDDAMVVNPGGDPVRVEQKLPMPEFVSFDGCFGPDGPARTEALPILEQAMIHGTVRDTDGKALPGVVVTVKSRALAVATQTVSDAMGRYFVEAGAHASDYFLSVDHPGFVLMELGPLNLEGGRSKAADLTMRTPAEMSETVVVEARGSVVETQASSTSSNFDAEFIEDATVVGKNDQNVLTIVPGVTEPDRGTSSNVQGARQTGLNYRPDGANLTDPDGGTLGQNLNHDIFEEIELITSGASAEYGRADGGFSNIVTRSGGPAAPPTVRGEASNRSEPNLIEEAALRVLADLADDGKLARSEGLPALAGLLRAQYSNGAFALSPRAQTLATWALAAAAASEPRLRWVPEAARKAAEFLTRMRSSCGLMEPGERAWADLVLELSGPSDSAGRCVDPRRPLERVRNDFNPSVARLVERILEGTRL